MSYLSELLLLCNSTTHFYFKWTILANKCTNFKLPCSLYIMSVVTQIYHEFTLIIEGILTPVSWIYQLSIILLVA